MSFLTCAALIFFKWGKEKKYLWKNYKADLTYTTFILQLPQKTDLILGLANEFQSEIRINTLFLDKAILIISEPAVSTLGTRTHTSDLSFWLLYSR